MTLAMSDNRNLLLKVRCNRDAKNAIGHETNILFFRTTMKHEGNSRHQLIENRIEERPREMQGGSAWEQGTNCLRRDEATAQGARFFDHERSP
jgi:hypothetical protein